MWHKLAEQLSDKSNELTELQPVSLGLPILKELVAMWMVDMSEYLAENPQIIVNGFVKAGITAALDRKQTEDTEDDVDYNTESDFDETESDSDEVDSDVQVIEI